MVGRVRVRSHVRRPHAGLDRIKWVVCKARMLLQYGTMYHTTK